jgi:hypothetical protein
MAFTAFVAFMGVDLPEEHLSGKVSDSANLNKLTDVKK